MGNPEDPEASGDEEEPEEGKVEFIVGTKSIVLSFRGDVTHSKPLGS